MPRVHVKPGQNVRQAIEEATEAHDKLERLTGRSTMTFEPGIDHVVLNGHRIVRPSGVSRSGWISFWDHVCYHIVHLH